MWNKIKETVTSKFFWVGFCEGFLIFPLFFDSSLYKKIVGEKKNECAEIGERVKRIHGFK